MSAPLPQQDAEIRRIQVSLGSGQYVHVDIDAKRELLDEQDLVWLDEIVRCLYQLGQVPE